MTVPAHHDVAVVTGAGRGLGRAFAHRFAAKGWRILVTDVDDARARAVAAEITAHGGTAQAFALDVMDKAAFQAGLDRAAETWGGAGILVNNAGLTRTTPLFEITPEEFSEVVTVNLRGTFLGCQVFGRYFADQKYGRIINLASLAGQNGGAATGAHYAASKGGIVTLTKVFARDLAAHGVTVNAIAPGPLDVDLVQEILPPAKLDAVVRSIPVGHLGDPFFIAEIACLMASPEATSMTGATVDANGGLYVR